MLYIRRLRAKRGLAPEKGCAGNKQWPQLAIGSTKARPWAFPTQACGKARPRLALARLASGLPLALQPSSVAVRSPCQSSAKSFFFPDSDAPFSVFRRPGFWGVFRLFARAVGCFEGVGFGNPFRGAAPLCFCVLGSLVWGIVWLFWKVRSGPGAWPVPFPKLKPG